MHGSHLVSKSNIHHFFTLEVRLKLSPARWTLHETAEWWCFGGCNQQRWSGKAFPRKWPLCRILQDVQVEKEREPCTACAKALGWGKHV